MAAPHFAFITGTADMLIDSETVKSFHVQAQFSGLWICKTVDCWVSLPGRHMLMLLFGGSGRPATWSIWIGCVMDSVLFMVFILLDLFNNCTIHPNKCYHSAKSHSWSRPNFKFAASYVSALVSPLRWSTTTESPRVIKVLIKLLEGLCIEPCVILGCSPAARHG